MPWIAALDASVQLQDGSCRPPPPHAPSHPPSTTCWSKPFSLRPPILPPGREGPSLLPRSPHRLFPPWLSEDLYPRTHRSRRTPLYPEAPPSLRRPLPKSFPRARRRRTNVPADESIGRESKGLGDRAFVPGADLGCEEEPLAPLSAVIHKKAGKVMSARPGSRRTGF